jgi:hypothetical protein
MTGFNPMRTYIALFILLLVTALCISMARTGAPPHVVFAVATLGFAFTGLGLGGRLWSTMTASRYEQVKLVPLSGLPRILVLMAWVFTALSVITLLMRHS